MLTTAPPSTTSLARAGDADVPTRTVGMAALTFTGVVILQNLIRGSATPANDASTADLVRYYADHRGVSFLLVAAFVVSGTALAIFLGGAARRLTTGPRPAWAYTGLIGAVAVLVEFSMLVACEGALSSLAHGATPDASAITTIWTLHNSAFTVLWLSIGIALLGLGRAGVAAGITPQAFEWIAPVGFACLALAVVGGPAITGGGAMPLFGLGLVGFVCWLAFVATTGLRLVRAGREQVTA